MKKGCPYCHKGKLTLKNTYDFWNFNREFPNLNAGLKLVRKDYIPENCFYRRYVCDNCGHLIWSYEEVFHRVPKREKGIHLPKSATVDIYKDGEYVGTEMRSSNTEKIISGQIEDMTNKIPEDKLNDILRYMRQN